METAKITAEEKTEVLKQINEVKGLLDVLTNNLDGLGLESIADLVDEAMAKVRLSRTKVTNVELE